MTCGGERGVGETTTTIAGWEVASSSSLKGGDEGGGTSSVVVIVELHWRRCWREWGVGEHRCLLS